MATKKKMLQAAAGSAGGSNIGAWDLSYAYYDASESSLGDVSTAIRDQFQNTTDTLWGVSASPDGMHIYVVRDRVSIEQYDLTIPWDLSQIDGSPDDTYNHSSTDSNCRGVYFRYDGLKMYTVGTSSDAISEFDLDPAWSVSSAILLRQGAVAAGNAGGLWFKPDGTKVYLPDGQSDVYEYDLSEAWNVGTLQFVHLKDFGPTGLSGITFTPDGKTAIVSTSADGIRGYGLATAWDISTAGFIGNEIINNSNDVHLSNDGRILIAPNFGTTYLSKYRFGALDVGFIENNPSGLTFKPDGSKMYLVGIGTITATSDQVQEYDVGSKSLNYRMSLSTSYLANFIKPDGTKLYLLNGGDIYQYDLRTAWDIGTGKVEASFDLNISSAQDIFFKPDGTFMYVLDASTDYIREYSLSTAWQVNTATFVREAKTTAEAYPSQIFFKPDGTKLFITGQQGDDIEEFILSPAWDISSLDNTPDTTSPTMTEALNPFGMFFKPDGLTVFILSNSTDDIHEYTLGSAWDVSNMTHVQSFDPAALAFRNINPQFYSISFKPDGTELYVTEKLTYKIVTFALSTPWDISTASIAFNPSRAFEIETAVHNQTYNSAPYESAPHGIAFKPDGTKMYIVGSSGDEVNEFDLATPWDSSSRSASRLQKVSTEDTNPTGLFFKPDGSKMYVCGRTNDNVYEYTLSTPWSVQSESLTFTKDVSPETTNPEDVFFKEDGSKMYVIGTAPDSSVHEYELSTPWSVETAQHTISFSVEDNDDNVRGLYITPDGTRMFIAGEDNQAVMPYTLGPEN